MKSGLRIRHYPRAATGELIEHEGNWDDCPDPGCAWPRVGSMVTARFGHLERTGILLGKDGGRMTVETHSGARYEAESVRRPEWGMYCPHGMKLSEAVPAEHTCKRPPESFEGFLPGYGQLDPEPCAACLPRERWVDPWPCPFMSCSRAACEEERRKDAEAYYEEMSQSLYG